MVVSEVVADWYFEDRSKLILSRTYADLRRLVMKSSECVAVLQDHGLLFPHKVVFSSGRYKYDNNNKFTRMVDKTELVIDVEKTIVGDLPATIFSVVEAEQIEDGFLCPVSISVIGVGDILTSNGQVIQEENVVQLDLLLTDAYVINVLTYSDAWLKFDLKGVSQEIVWLRNAPRLESALLEIEKCIGVKATIDKYSWAVKYDQYRLENIRDDDGELLSVI